jgi:dTDP-4-amino-4,6-dideoxygalactose transaminase
MSNATHLIPDIPQAFPRAFFQQHREEAIEAMSRVLDNGWYILGNEVKAFESEFTHEFEYGGAVGSGNGTDAIALALRSLGVGRGDRVATVSHTAVATVAAIEMIGASPVFVDISADSYTMDPESLKRTLEAHAPIAAVIVVHLYGNPADMSALLRIANQFDAWVIEDCAQAHGAKLEGQFVGGMADAGTFSFYPTKNLGALGDGGLVVSRDPEQIRRLRMLREYGWERRFISDLPGINSRLDELQAAILRVRLPYLAAGNRRRAEIAARYDKGLSDVGLQLPTRRPGAVHVFHQYVVRHSDRDSFQVRLKENGIGTNVHYPVPVHRQPAYAGRCDCDPRGLVATDIVASQILSLPMFPELMDAAIERIVETVRNLA